MGILDKKEEEVLRFICERRLASIEEIRSAMSSKFNGKKELEDCISTLLKEKFIKEINFFWSKRYAITLLGQKEIEK